MYFTVFVTVRAVDVHQFPHQSVRGPDRPSSRALLQVLLPCVSPHLLQHSLALVIKAFRTVRLILPDADRGRERQREESRQTYVRMYYYTPYMWSLQKQIQTHMHTHGQHTYTHREREENNRCLLYFPLHQLYG